MIIFGGAEIPSNRTLLERNGVTNMMVNFWSLKKRGLPKNKPYLIGEHFLPETKVWVESGARQADAANLSKYELESYAIEYEEFIAFNHDRIEGWVEFDSEVLGLPWINQQRAAFEGDSKMHIVWHSNYNTPLLREWAKTYSNIAITGQSLEATPSLANITRMLQAQYPVQFHGLGIAKPDNMRQVPFSTTSTLSWLRPMRSGETIIWDGAKLVRYPKRMKDQARLRYKSVVDRAGLDFQKFKDDDTLEATKVAIWSYQQLDAKINKDQTKPMLADNSDDTLYTGLMEMGGNGSNNSDIEMRKLERTEVTERDPNEVVSMPVLGYQIQQIVESENGRDVLKDAVVVQSSSVSLRQCNTCFVAANCPAFKENNTCGFNLPVEVKTPEQLKALNTALLEMQAQRVMFMRFAEELNGGYADPNLGQEIDRYQKMLKNVKELDETKEFIQITAQRNASQGVLSAIFGDRVQALKEQQPSISEEQTTLIIQKNIEG